MITEKEYNQIILTFTRIINQFAQLEKNPRDFGTGDVLFPSEVHMIDVIGKNPGINITGLAKVLGVTKGAVPKIIAKLDRKGLLNRYRRGDNQKEVLLELSKRGIVAFEGHKEFHRRTDEDLKQKLRLLDDSQIRFLKVIFADLDKYAGEMLKE